MQALSRVSQSCALSACWRGAVLRFSASLCEALRACAHSASPLWPHHLLTLPCRMQSHGNFSEYAPFGVILCGLAELSGRGGPVLLHTLGVLMLAGRLMYAYASSVPSEQMIKSMARVYCRIWGMVLTYASLAGASALCVGLPSVGGWAAVALFLAIGSTKSPSSKARAAIRKNSGSASGGDKQ